MNRLRWLFWSYSALLLVLAVLPINGPNNKVNNTYLVNIRGDYVIHTLIFAIWILLYKFAFLPQKGFFKPALILPLLFYVSLLAIISESLQLLVSFRSFNINDLAANFLGIIIGFIALGLLSLRTAD